jgi:hypothetical protein
MSKKIALFVSEEALKNYVSSLNQNVSPESLVPSILLSQDIELQTFLGSTFYFHLQNEILNGTVSENNQFLIDNYISKAVIQFTMVHALPTLNWKIYNKSVQRPGSENSETATLEEIKFLQQEYRNVGNQYMEKLVYWINLHPGDYPVYFSQKVTDGNMPSYQSPIAGTLVMNRMPYAWKKRRGWLANSIQDGMWCEGIFPNTYTSTTIK